jgi:hypothetical protein
MTLGDVLGGVESECVGGGDGETTGRSSLEDGGVELGLE